MEIILSILLAVGIVAVLFGVVVVVGMLMLQVDEFYNRRDE